MVRVGSQVGVRLHRSRPRKKAFGDPTYRDDRTTHGPDAQNSTGHLDTRWDWQPRQTWVDDTIPVVTTYCTADRSVQWDKVRWAEAYWGAGWKMEGVLCGCVLPYEEHVVISVNGSLMLSRLQPIQRLVVSASLPDVELEAVVWGLFVWPTRSVGRTLYNV